MHFMSILRSWNLNNYENHLGINSWFLSLAKSDLKYLFLLCSNTLFMQICPHVCIWGRFIPSCSWRQSLIIFMQGEIKTRCRSQCICPWRFWSSRVESKFCSHFVKHEEEKTNIQHKTETKIKLICVFRLNVIGKGNPSRQYQQHSHNADK